MFEIRKLYIRAAAHCVYFGIMGVLGVLRVLCGTILDDMAANIGTSSTRRAAAVDTSLVLVLHTVGAGGGLEARGRPDLVLIVVAAGGLGAVVFNLLNSAETGVVVRAMLGGFDKGGVVDAIGNFGFPPDRAPSFRRGEIRKQFIGAAAHFVCFGIGGVLA